MSNQNVSFDNVEDVIGPKPVGQIYSLIPKIMREIGVVAKTQRNTQQGFDFRGIDDLYNALSGPMGENGVFVTQKVVKQRHKMRERKGKEGNVFGVTYSTVLTVKHTFFAGDGSCVVCTTVGKADDCGDKSASKAMSAAMKSALVGIFCIRTADNCDPDADPGQNGSGDRGRAPAPKSAPAANNGQQRPATVNNGQSKAAPGAAAPRSGLPAAAQAGKLLGLPSPAAPAAVFASAMGQVQRAIEAGNNVTESKELVVDEDGAELDPSAFDLTHDREFGRLWQAYARRIGLAPDEARALLRAKCEKRGIGFPSTDGQMRKQMMGDIARMTEGAVREFREAVARRRGAVTA